MRIYNYYKTTDIEPTGPTQLEIWYAIKEETDITGREYWSFSQVKSIKDIVSLKLPDATIGSYLNKLASKGCLKIIRK